MNKFRSDLLRILFCGLIGLLTSDLAAQFEVLRIRELPPPELDNLIQGQLNVPDYRGIQESPYLLLEYLPGSVRYLNRQYQNLPLRYDTFADQVVFLHRTQGGIQKIRLVKDYIEYFTLNTRLFINIDYGRYRGIGLTSGYYEVFFEDEISLLARRYADIEHEDALPYFKQRTTWILVKDGQAYPVRNKKTLVKALGVQYKKSVSAFLRQQGIILRKASDAQWLQVASYLNTLLQSN